MYISDTMVTLKRLEETLLCEHERAFQRAKNVSERGLSTPALECWECLE